MTNLPDPMVKKSPDTEENKNPALKVIQNFEPDEENIKPGSEAQERAHGGRIWNCNSADCWHCIQIISVCIKQREPTV